MADLSVFGKVQGVSDYQRQKEALMMKNQLMRAQIGLANRQANEIDVDKLGERAFMKAAQGLELTPQELAAAQFIDAKSGGVQFNPVTGAMLQKPRISERIGLPGMEQPQAMPQATPNAMPNILPQAQSSPRGNMTPDQASQINDLFGEPPAEMTPQQEMRIEYERNLAAAAGNPKLQQEIKSAWAKAQMEMNDAESKAAGFADRISSADPLIEKFSQAGMNPADVAKSNVPLVGNYLVSKEYQNFDQARRDFINAQLRRESGAVISPAEFENANRQYFPQPGDSPEVLAQKKANRLSALKGMQRGAGAAYKPSQPVILQRPGDENSDPLGLRR